MDKITIFEANIAPMKEKKEPEYNYEGEVRVSKYNPLKHVRLSSELLDFTSSLLRLKSVHSLKLLFALAQSVQGRDIQRFPIIKFDIAPCFDYLGIQGSNKRYDVLRDAFQDVRLSGLDIVKKGKRGRVFIGMNWISRYEFSEDDSTVSVWMNPHAEEYLLQLSQYVSISPQHYIALNTTYQTLLYTYLKDKAKLGVWRVKIEELRKFLAPEDKSYSPEIKNGTEVFLKRVIGIKISQAAKEENIRAKKQRRHPLFVAWDYTQHNGEPNGTLKNINDKTDLFVEACAVKTGRSYTHLVFTFLKEPRQPITQHQPQNSDVAFLETPLGKYVRNIREEEVSEETLNDLLKQFGTVDNILKLCHATYTLRGEKLYQIFHK